VSARQPTKGTEIAALEAQRNELEVRAEGALLGERRAALARVVMIAMFGTVTQLSAKDRPPATMYLGAAYSFYAIAVLVGVVRQKKAVTRRARWFPVMTTVIDYSFTTTQSLLAASVDGFHPGQHALSSMLLMTFAVARLSVWHIVLAAACAEASWIVVTTHVGVATEYPTLFVEGGLVVMAFLLALTNRALGKMFHGLRQRDNLTRFLPRQVVARVLDAGPAALAPVEREVTVLFSDIRGFTGLAEGLEPREVLAMLDDYFGRMAMIVKGHDGVVGKFLGDGLLAFWGVPDRIDDHAERAVRAARDMRRALIELNRYREQDGLPPIRIGIGIHTGRVAAGMLGGELQSEYTVIGDAVNVASRIEGLTKEHQVDLLLSETTWGQLADGKGAHRIAEAPIRGRKEPVVLYGFSDDPGGEP
jgi:adenylate cyclase